MIKPLALALSLLATSCYASDVSGQYWKDWLETKKTSPNLRMVTYVHRISTRSAEAAAWFLLTGGKNGFIKRQATPEETVLMKESLRNIACFLSILPESNHLHFKTRIFSFQPRYYMPHYKILEAFEEELKAKTVKTEEYLYKSWETFVTNLNTLKESYLSEGNLEGTEKLNSFMKMIQSTVVDISQEGELEEDDYSTLLHSLDSLYDEHPRLNQQNWCALF